MGLSWLPIPRTGLGSPTIPGYKDMGFNVSGLMVMGPMGLMGARPVQIAHLAGYS